MRKVILEIDGDKLELRDLGSDETMEESSKLEEWQKRTIRLLRDFAREKKIKDEQLKILGSNLYAILFRDIRDKFYEKYNENDESVLLQLEFKTREEELFDFPWEYLCFPCSNNKTNTDQYLQDRRVTISRNFRVDKPRELKVNGDLRMLIIASGPNENFTDLQEAISKYEVAPIFHKKLIAEITNNAKKVIKDFKLIEDNQKNAESGETIHCTFDHFQTAVEELKPHLIHMLGHGRINVEKSVAEFLFISATGQPDWRTESEIADVFRKCNDLKLVFFESCSTAISSRQDYTGLSGLALQTVFANVPAVIAMQSAIQQDQANLFTQVFYQHLFSPKTIYEALEGAKEAIRENQNNYGIPVLYARGDGVLIPQKSEVNPADQQGSIQNAKTSGKSAETGTITITIQQLQEIAAEAARSAYKDFVESNKQEKDQGTRPIDLR